MVQLQFAGQCQRSETPEGKLMGRIVQSARSKIEEQRCL